MKNDYVRYFENLYEEPIALIAHDGFCEGQWGKPFTMKEREV